jgi:hypothetical protein
MSATPEAITKLSRDLRAAAKTLGVREARYFVNTYYDLQDYRIASANQQRKLLEGEEPSEFMGWLNSNLQAGLDPTSKWDKGEKRPWNASLKRLCFLIGESFIKVSSNPKDVYGKVYLSRKEYEARNNDAGRLADRARERLGQDKARKRKLDPELLKILESGKLPQMALHCRARRYAVKQFLSDWHAEAYRQHYHREPPLPYPIAHLGHVHVR